MNKIYERLKNESDENYSLYTSSELLLSSFKNAIRHNEMRAADRRPRYDGLVFITKRRETEGSNTTF